MKPEEFATLAQEGFAFLEREYGFSFSWKGEYIVRFDSSKVFVTVVYDATRSYELGVQIGLQPGNQCDLERSFEIWEILRSIGQGELQEAKSVIQSRAVDLQKYLGRLADLVRRYASGLLAGDIDLFTALSRQRAADSAAYALMAALSYARQNAEKAWKRGRYEEVIKELEPVADHLSPAEQKMLAIACKRVHSDHH